MSHCDEYDVIDCDDEALLVVGQSAPFMILKASVIASVVFSTLIGLFRDGTEKKLASISEPVLADKMVGVLQFRNGSVLPVFSFSYKINYSFILL